MPTYREWAENQTECTHNIISSLQMAFATERTESLRIQGEKPGKFHKTIVLNFVHCISAQYRIGPSDTPIYF